MYLIDCPIGLVAVRIMAVVWRSIVRRVMGMVVVLGKVDDAMIQRALKPCRDIGASLVDVIVGILRLILYSANEIVDLVQSAIEHVLSIIDDSPFRLLNVPENLSVSDDEG